LGGVCEGAGVGCGCCEVPTGGVCGDVEGGAGVGCGDCAHTLAVANEIAKAANNWIAKTGNFDFKIILQIL
jgi:hypothetical protein